MLLAEFRPSFADCNLRFSTFKDEVYKKQASSVRKTHVLFFDIFVVCSLNICYNYKLTVIIFYWFGTRNIIIFCNYTLYGKYGLKIVTCFGSRALCISFVKAEVLLMGLINWYRYMWKNDITEVSF